MDIKGYKTQSGHVIIKQGRIAVIGKKDMGEYGTEYVAWTYSINSSGQPEFVWGRYCSTLEKAEERFNMKENDKYSG